MPRGRPRGSKNKATEAREALLAAGIEPREVMLANMRYAYDQALESEKMVSSAIIKGVDEEQHFERVRAAVMRGVGFRKIAQECAEGAAKYCHPTMQSVAHGDGQGGPVIVEVRWKGEDDDGG